MPFFCLCMNVSFDRSPHYLKNVSSHQWFLVLIHNFEKEKWSPLACGCCIYFRIVIVVRFLHNTFSLLSHFVLWTHLSAFVYKYSAYVMILICSYMDGNHTNAKLIAFFSLIYQASTFNSILCRKNLFGELL